MILSLRMALLPLPANDMKSPAVRGQYQDGWV
jgi:hypothetical protein